MLVQGWGLIGAWPFHLTFYNMMVGGRSGAERLGFETMYWGEAFDRESWRALESAVGRIAEADSPSSEHEKPRVSFVGVAREVPEYLQTRGYLTREFVPVRPDANESDYLVVVRSQGWLARDGRLDLLQSGALAKALFVRRHRSMPLCWILSADAEHRSRRPETER